jgi:DNA-binding protein YbaB
MPEDLSNLMKKAQALAVHMEKKQERPAQQTQHAGYRGTNPQTFTLL